MMDNYTCLIADKEMLIKKWDKEISKHGGSAQWKKWKENSLRNINTRIVYMGMLGSEIITEATAIISDKDLNIQNRDMLVGGSTAYLSAFRTDSNYEGKGYFSKLYKFMENDLICRGFNTLTLGVEPCEVRNMQIYFGWGFNTFIKTAYEFYPPEIEGAEPEKIMVNYYLKKCEKKRNDIRVCVSISEEIREITSL